MQIFSRLDLFCWRYFEKTNLEDKQHYLFVLDNPKIYENYYKKYDVFNLKEFKTFSSLPKDPYDVKFN